MGQGNQSRAVGEPETKYVTESVPVQTFQTVVENQTYNEQYQVPIKVPRVVMEDHEVTYEVPAMETRTHTVKQPRTVMETTSVPVQVPRTVQVQVPQPVTAQIPIRERVIETTYQQVTPQQARSVAPVTMNTTGPTVDRGMLPQQQYSYPQQYGYPQQNGYPQQSYPSATIPANTSGNNNDDAISA